jgi:hypothetical protein
VREPQAQAVPALCGGIEQADGYVRYRALVLLTVQRSAHKDAMRESLVSTNDGLRGLQFLRT